MGEDKCDTCKHEDTDFDCSRCGMITLDGKIDLYEPKTNADRIRSMSDEELAEFLPMVLDLMCTPTDTCLENIFNRGECEKTKECALKWLQSEVE